MINYHVINYHVINYHMLIYHVINYHVLNYNVIIYLYSVPMSLCDVAGHSKCAINTRPKMLPPTGIHVHDLRHKWVW